MAITTIDEVKTFLGITGNSQDARINLIIPTVEADYLAIRNKNFEEDSNGEIYPDGANITACQMVGFMLTYESKTGNRFQSESIGKWSRSNSDMFMGYPIAITEKIKRYLSTI